jgi:uncharacterized membrane protein
MGGFKDKLARRLRHLQSGIGPGEKLFPQNVLDLITAAIAEGEATHRGEVRLIVEAALPGELIWDGVTDRERALDLFAEHGIWDTEDNCGVLVYVNLADHKVEIVADRAINRKVAHAQWQAICDTMTQGFCQGEYGRSTLAAIEQVNALLRQHFPADGSRGPDVNELPNQPVMI